MNKQDLYYFNLLKKSVTNTFLKDNNASILIEEWKGEDIVAFQEDLFVKVKAKVSEKWFYTYFKNDAKKLPRIDILNLLSEYVGLKNWNTFKASHKNKLTITSKKLVYVFLLLISLIITAFFLFVFNKNQFHFCFVDDIKNQPITSIPINIKILQNEESPLYFKTDTLGCFDYKTKDNRIKFVVQSPYHKTDTIIRFIDSNSNQIVKLITDDYALMLHYYSNGNVKDWKKHKQQLSNLIADDAEIYQLFDNNFGVELFTKDEFIRLLTIPTKSLKRVKVLGKGMRNGKIVKLKFIMK
ncbi:hypothetical protein Q4Q35_02610 [Flavivirga aquimarina]|uniref:Uncharacterized protein n=1 Tax=Flavivirga aquimarina TaxID=2027862 RepID=A0ABT8W6E0_9FLAO|nr:hypothetical protein [Flavivirga aquimarina]MDO5968689.1 hypothetical protein [Flavivirga aquimarina]